MQGKPLVLLLSVLYGSAFIAGFNENLVNMALVSIMAVPDIMQRARSFVGTTYLYFETYTMVAIIYLIITLVLSKAVSIMESRLNYYDGK